MTKKDLPQGETPAEAVEETVDVELERQADESGLAGVFAGRITFHRPTRLEDPEAPGVARLEEALEEFLGQKYGFAVNVSLSRTDR